MSEVIIAPDSETILISYLDSAYSTYTDVGGTDLSSARAYGKVPNPRPSLFTRVIRTGGNRDRFIDQATLTVESWGPDEITAQRLAALNQALIFKVGQVSVSGTTYQTYRPQEFAGPARLPDPDSDQERYTQTVSVGFRAYAA